MLAELDSIRKNPGELFYDNLLMGTYLMDQAQKNGVEKFVSLGTMCSYPKITPQPIKEEYLWEGYPEEVTSAYGLAKKMQIVQSIAYKQQYNFNSITVFECERSVTAKFLSSHFFLILFKIFSLLDTTIQLFGAFQRILVWLFEFKNIASSGNFKSSKSIEEIFTFDFL